MLALLGRAATFTVSMTARKRRAATLVRECEQEGGRGATAQLPWWGGLMRLMEVARLEANALKAIRRDHLKANTLG